MQYFLAKSCLPIAKMLAREKTLCAFDFDGTLSSIVEHPEQAGMRARTRELLVRLSSLYPCIVVSGRSRADVLEKLRGVRLARVIGNHGAETEATRGSRHCLDRWKATLDMELGSEAGVWIEDKGFSLAVHYRQSPRKAEARRRIFSAASTLQHVRVFGGKLVVNLTPDRAPNKGDALALERDRLGCHWVVYLGDDDNDEDAFALGGNVIPIRIGRKLGSHARYYLRSQAEIDSLLEMLVKLREVSQPVS